MQCRWQIDFISPESIGGNKKALNQELPATISIPHVDKSTVSEQPCKKMESNVDDCAAFSEKHYQMIC